LLQQPNGDGEDLSLPLVGVVVLVVAVAAAATAAAAALREQRTPPPLAVMVVMVVVGLGKKGSRRNLDYNRLGKETVCAYVTFFAPMVLTVPARGYTNAHWPNPPG
jgi:apolipoprotein N-acyltransferase